MLHAQGKEQLSVRSRKSEKNNRERAGQQMVLPCVYRYGSIEYEGYDLIFIEKLLNIYK